MRQTNNWSSKPDPALAATVVEQAEVGMFFLIPEGTIVYGNDAGVKFLGRSDKGVAGLRVEEVVEEADRPVLTTALQQLQRSEISRFRYECRWLRHDAGRPWGKVTLSMLRNADQTHSLVLAMVEDISACKEVEEELHHVSRRLARSREESLQRLAQNLHDGPIQDVYAAQYQLEALGRALEPERRQRFLGTARDILHQVSNGLRTIMFELRPALLSPFGLPVALHALADHFQKRFPEMRLSREIAFGGDALSDFACLALYRIAREMLENVAQHAGAQRVLIRLAERDGMVRLEVQDDGVGFDVPQRWIELVRRDRLGLARLAWRVEELDGRLAILSAPQKGTIVCVDVPGGDEPGKGANDVL